MNQDAFWDLIELVDGTGGLAELIDRLTALGEEEIVSFDKHIREAVQALETPAHLAQKVADVADGGEALPLGEDSFEYARFSVVASGRSTWQAVRDQPKLFAQTWDFDLGEDLSKVVSAAYEAATGGYSLTEPLSRSLPVDSPSPS